MNLSMIQLQVIWISGSSSPWRHHQSCVESQKVSSRFLAATPNIRGDFFFMEPDLNKSGLICINCAWGKSWFLMALQKCRMPSIIALNLVPCPHLLLPDPHPRPNLCKCLSPWTCRPHASILTLGLNHNAAPCNLDKILALDLQLDKQFTPMSVPVIYNPRVSISPELGLAVKTSRLVFLFIEEVWHLVPRS